MGVLTFTDVKLFERKTYVWLNVVNVFSVKNTVTYVIQCKCIDLYVDSCFQNVHGSWQEQPIFQTKWPEPAMWASFSQITHPCNNFWHVWGQICHCQWQTTKTFAAICWISLIVCCLDPVRWSLQILEHNLCEGWWPVWKMIGAKGTCSTIMKNHLQFLLARVLKPSMSSDQSHVWSLVSACVMIVARQRIIFGKKFKRLWNLLLQRAPLAAANWIQAWQFWDFRKGQLVLTWMSAVLFQSLCISTWATSTWKPGISLCCSWLLVADLQATSSHFV